MPGILPTLADRLAQRVRDAPAGTFAAPYDQPVPAIDADKQPIVQSRRRPEFIRKYLNKLHVVVTPGNIDRDTELEDRCCSGNLWILDVAIAKHLDLPDALAGDEDTIEVADAQEIDGLLLFAEQLFQYLSNAHDESGNPSGGVLPGDASVPEAAVSDWEFVSYYDPTLLAEDRTFFSWLRFTYHV